MHQYTFKSRIIGVTTIVALVLLCSCSYELACLSTVPPSNATTDSMQQGSLSPPLKAAVIIEGRTLPNLVPLILHFSSGLGPEWPIKVLPHQATAAALEHQLHESRCPPYEHLLLFQSDSILCANSPRMLEDFLEYDFVGAPIDPKYGQGMNGGLSLRKRETMFEVLERNQFTGRPDDGSKFEDQWFFQKLEELPPGPNNKTGANLPSLGGSRAIWKNLTGGVRNTA
ncbi:MAG: hypothetical protein Q9192_002023 [Flavoplaca navasiana]